MFPLELYLIFIWVVSALFTFATGEQFLDSNKPFLRVSGLLGGLQLDSKAGPALGLDLPTEQPKPGFEPYTLNGGTIAAIAGKGYVVLAADTRLAQGYSILSRNQSRIAQITDGVVMGTGGCWTDFTGLVKQLQYVAKKYAWENRKLLSVQAFSNLLSIMLYQRRLFPYYAFNIVAGLDENGVGAVYSYDAIGSFQRVPAASTGSAQHLVQPALDLLCEDLAKDHLDISVDEALSALKETFVAGAEREIHLGDCVELIIIEESKGMRREYLELASH